MNSGEIEEYLQDLIKKTKIKSAFVLARDELPFVDISKRPVALIVNTDNRNLPGKHWTAFFVNKRNYFFDSYHNSYKKYKFEPQFKVHSSNSKVFQDKDSSTCGYWSLLWLYYMAKGKKFDSKFNKNLKINEAKLMRDFRKKFSLKTCHSGQICCSRINNSY